MDLAYDHITEQSLPKDEDGKGSTNGNAAPKPTLNADFQAAYSALSASPWASRIGGFFGNVVKQGGSIYQEAQQEVAALGQDATKGLTDLRNNLAQRTRGLSLATTSASAGTSAAADGSRDLAVTPTAESSAAAAAAAGSDEATVLAQIKSQAAQRLKDLQRAEDAADEALVKFGSNIRDFLRDAISIAPPDAQGSGTAAGGSAGGSQAAGRRLLFESKDAQGKRVIHTSRFDAQLHVIHSNVDSFAKDPSASAEYASWSKDFDIDGKTQDIAGDLNKYPELRVTMEKLVPDSIPYADFWKRYYFLRHGIETAEARRRDLLKAASAEEEIGWDEDSDDEDSDDDSDDSQPVSKANRANIKRPGSTGSSTTIHPPTAAAAAAATTAAAPNSGLLKTAVPPRRSNDEKSQADSEASYDIVGAKSGVPSQAASQAPNSPRQTAKVDEDSEEEDWE